MSTSTNTTWMRKLVMAAGLTTALALTGCVVVPAHRYAVTGEVRVAPPVGYANGYVWIDGYWRGGYGHRWVPGHWGPRHY